MQRGPSAGRCLPKDYGFGRILRDGLLPIETYSEKEEMFQTQNYLVGLRVAGTSAFGQSRRNVFFSPSPSAPGLNSAWFVGQVR
jgi:hypothetical protein